MTLLAKVFCLASAKGGSGKTVLAATFGTFLAGVRKKVLLIDTDAATNGLSLFYLKEANRRKEEAVRKGRTPRGIYECSIADEPEIVELGSGVHLIPVSYSFQDLELLSVDRCKEQLRGCIAALRDKYDYIFLDAQAGSDLYARISMARDISSEVVIVSEYDPVSAAGVERLKALLRDDLTHERTWVLLNKMLPEFARSFSDFLEVAKYLSPVPWDADVVRAFARRKLALDLEKGNEHTLAVMQTLTSLLGDEIEQDLEEWKRGRETFIREPIAIQLKDVEVELEGVVKARIDREYELRIIEARTNRIEALAPLVVLLGAAGLIWLLGSLVASNAPELVPSWLFPKMLILPVIALIISGGIAITWPLISEARMRHRVGELWADKRALERREDDLNDKRKKLQSIFDSDLTTLVKQRSFSVKPTYRQTG